MEISNQHVSFLFIMGIVILFLKSITINKNLSINSIDEEFLPHTGSSVYGGISGDNYDENIYNNMSNDNPSYTSFNDFETTEINPANGLPMIGGIGGVDCEGNAYGFSSDSYSHD
ncbi:MAG: hypothetical protein WC680_11145 [Sulfuricurvum sp.]|jgi:hypothetical protein